MMVKTRRIAILSVLLMFSYNYYSVDGLPCITEQKRNIFFYLTFLSMSCLFSIYLSIKE